MRTVPVELEGHNIRMPRKDPNMLPYVGDDVIEGSRDERKDNANDDSRNHRNALDGSRDRVDSANWKKETSKGPIRLKHLSDEENEK